MTLTEIVANSHAEQRPTTDEDDKLQCHNGEFCFGAGPQADPAGWACCAERGGRAMCPPNWPIMCAQGGDLADRGGYSLNPGVSDGWCWDSPEKCDGAGGVAHLDACPSGKWCFEIALQEAPCLDQWHVDETVNWMVLEEGSFNSDDGAHFQVGKLQVVGDGWTRSVSSPATALRSLTTPHRCFQCRLPQHWLF